ncbi:MAG TPA: sugar transferase [Candidatus Limnocylindria bacterium]|jgi:exopolysaccharide biosynthesis polyprenyl glycosylphosphotransferase
MIRRHLMALRIGLMALDGLIAAAVFIGVAALRYRDGDPDALWRAMDIAPWLAAVLFATLWVLALWTVGLYRLSARWNVWTEVRDIARATLLVIALTLSALFLFKQNDVSRLYLIILFIAEPTVTLIGRLGFRAVFEASRQRGHNARYMVIAGTGRLAQDFADQLEQHRGLGVQVIGHLRAPGERKAAVTRPILGTIDDIEEILHAQVVDELGVCLPASAWEYLDPLTQIAASEGKTVRIAVDPVHELPSGDAEEVFDRFLVRSIVNDGHREAGLIFKRLIDIVGAGLGLIILSPILLGTVLAIRLSDHKPALFGQTRIGLHGRPFTMYKFRSMVMDAEARLHEVRHLNERSHVAFKATNDPRITRIGRGLRRTSIDELPQLWNVLTGSMSLVGPRPPLPREVVNYDIWHRRRLSMKPGMTGLWQVEARNEADFDAWVEHDLVYIDGWSLWLDFKILAKTLPAVLANAGR